MPKCAFVPLPNKQNTFLCSQMCLCKTDECNQDKTAAKKSLNIPDSAEWDFSKIRISLHYKSDIRSKPIIKHIILKNFYLRPLKCAESDCPVTDLSTVIDGWEGFNSACYKKDSEEKEHCFTTEGIYDEDVVRWVYCYVMMRMYKV